jgi:hypothetical protein
MNTPIQRYVQDDIIFTAVLKKCDNPSVGMEKDYVLLTIKNTSSKPVKVDLEQHLYFDGICKTCLNSEYHREYTLAAFETLAGLCDDSSSKGLKMFHGSPWVPEVLTKFELANIKISNK